MRIDKDFLFFIDHHDWYTFDLENGYLPAADAPEEAVEAIERYKKTKAERHRLGYMD